MTLHAGQRRAMEKRSGTASSGPAHREHFVGVSMILIYVIMYLASRRQIAQRDLAEITRALTKPWNA